MGHDYADRANHGPINGWLDYRLHFMAMDFLYQYPRWLDSCLNDLESTENSRNAYAKTAD